MLRPLNQFICDECGKLIERPEEGFLEWLGKKDANGNFVTGFRIVHARGFSPLKEERRDGCFLYGSSPDKRDMHPDYILEHSPQYLLNFWDLGKIIDPEGEIPPRIRDIRQFTEIFRRLTVPFYEEARLFIEEAHNEGSLEGYNEIALYSKRTLKSIIEEYGYQEGSE